MRVQISEIFRALSDDTRLRILLLLERMELSVGELAVILDQSQPRVSRHVRILAEAGLVVRRKEGSWVFLERFGTDGSVNTALARLLKPDNFNASPLEPQIHDDLARLSMIAKQREESAAAYFAAHAEDWDSIRSLHVAESEVEKAILDLLGRDRALGDLLDIGTGTGRMIELLGGQASAATAFDRSPDMLRLARARIAKTGGSQVRFIQGDFNALPIDGQSFDTIVLHQVLHYAHSPQQVIAEAGRVARRGARLLVVDFAPHEREELRERDAHVRLGFSDSQIAAMFGAAGFRTRTDVCLDGGDLSVKLWLGEKTSKPGQGMADEIETREMA
jgi:ubiquinone/menaquinone biosynthesis C-methylase UbiE